MAQIELRLSTKFQKETGMCEVLIRFFQGTKFNVRAKSGVFVSPNFFEYYIDRAKSEKLGVKVAASVTTMTEEKAKKQNVALRQSGLIVIKQRLETPNVKYHREQSDRLVQMKKHILEAYEANRNVKITSNWLQLVVDSFNNPETIFVQDKNKTFYELAEEYIAKRKLAYTHAKVFRVLMREVARYEGYIRATDYNRSEFTFDIDTVTKVDIENFIDYLRHEYTLSLKHKRLFKKLLTEYPASVTKGHSKLEDRGENTVIKGAKRLKSLFRFFYEPPLRWHQYLHGKSWHTLLYYDRGTQQDSGDRSCCCIRKTVGRRPERNLQG